MIDFFNNNENTFINDIQEEEISVQENENENENLQNQDLNRQNIVYNLENIIIDNSQINDNTDVKTKNLFVTHKKLGRKRKSSTDDIYNSKQHNKYSDDNIRRKIKHLDLKSLSEFLNIQITNLCINCPKILILNQRQKFNATIKYNQDFLSKTLKDIFSENISERYRNYPLDHNAKVINNLLNCPNEGIKNYFKRLLNLNFLDSLKHFRGEEEIEELSGMTLFEDIKNNSDWENDYKDVLSNYINHYETFIIKKRPRLRKMIH